MLVSYDRIEELSEFCKICGVQFKDFDLLNKALTHTSWVYDRKLDRNESYERLEFLGDAVLKLSISDILFKEYPNRTEGQLSEKRSVIVSDKVISSFARQLHFSDFLLIGKCERDDVKGKESILACSFEAFLGAVYIEYKEEGYNRAKKFLVDNFLDEILNADCSNPKAELQELTQKYNHDLPEYVIMEEKGPAHDKTFVVGVYYRDKFIEKGSAKSKKEAEFDGAKKALVILKKQFEEV